MALKQRINASKLFQVVLISFVVIQVVSYLLSEVLGYPLLKMGWILFLFAIIILFTTLFTLGRKIGDLSMKKDGLFIILVIGIIIALFVYLPDYLPQIFSVQSLEIKEFLREVIGTIVKVGTGVV